MRRLGIAAVGLALVVGIIVGGMVGNPLGRPASASAAASTRVAQNLWGGKTLSVSGEGGG